MTGPADLNLTGVRALVTGGTRGLGREIALRLGAAGCRLVLNHVRDDRTAATTAAELADLGCDVRLVRADVGRADGVAYLLDQVAGTFGELDVLVHSAVTLHRMSAVDADPGSCDRDRDVVLGLLTHGGRRLAELMTPGRGRVLTISSIGSARVIPGYLSLGTAKAALESLVRYLAVELAPHGVTVNAVAPGKLAGRPDDPVAARVAARTPAGRLTAPADVADVVALLCRPEAAWIHGQVVTVDGGLGLLA